MRGGSRSGAGRKRKPDHLRRELVTIRLPQWMILQLRNKGEIGYLIENYNSPQKLDRAIWCMLDASSSKKEAR